MNKVVCRFEVPATPNIKTMYPGQFGRVKPAQEIIMRIAGERYVYLKSGNMYSVDESDSIAIELIPKGSQIIITVNT